MDQDLEKITGGLFQELAAWLEKPSPLSKQIDALRAEVEAAKTGMKSAAFRDTFRQLKKAEAEIGRVRRRQAAEAIAETCRELGVVLEPKDPPKRKRRGKAKTGPKPGPTADPKPGQAPA